jgi:Na+/melibiose symporter-like transporter
MKRPLSLKILAGYGAIGVPLAFVGLPIYVHLPHYYATAHGMSLATIGMLLLVIRLLDAVCDPLIGLYSDRMVRWRRTIMLAAFVPLTLGFVGLFSPPALAEGMLLYWLAGALILVYLSFSVLMVNYYALATSLPEAAHANTLISGVREAALLVGVVLAAALPSLLQQHYGDALGFHYFALSFLPFVALAGWGIMACVTRSSHISAPAARLTWRECRVLRPVLPYYILLFLNSLPTSITSTLFLFYVEDFLHAKEQSGIMLLTFFLAAACSVPLWITCAKRKGEWWALRLAMMLAIISFSMTYFLSPHDASLFYVICLLSGIATGGDLTLLPALFTKTLMPYPHMSSVAFSGWHFLAKANLAIVAGVALPILSYIGYQPAVSTGDKAYVLVIAYAVIPCVIKCVALLWTYAVLRYHAVTKTSYTG